MWLLIIFARLIAFGDTEGRLDFFLKISFEPEVAFFKYLLRVMRFFIGEPRGDRPRCFSS